MKEYIQLFFKGLGMGAANVIPGVSGGTIALLTGIFEKLINSIKSLNLTALKLLFKGKFKEFADYINLWFLVAVFVGVGVSIISIARLFGFLFDNYPIYIWSYFFGLILASVYFVGKTVDKWNSSVIVVFIVGALIAIGLSMLKPATENDSFLYLILCGGVAACSMILPGLSGSFVLILLGNYQLVMINAVNNMDFAILLPVVIGAGVGILAFSWVLSWIFKHYKNQTIGLLTGFIFGSLGVLWPWKKSFDIGGNQIAINEHGAFIDQTGAIVKDVKVFGYEQIMPAGFGTPELLVLGLILAGIVSIWLLEVFAQKKTDI